MASKRGFVWKLCSVLICFFALLYRVKGAMKIVDPLPGHNVAIENETLRVTCVVFDQENENVIPLGVNFYRVDKFGDTTLIVDQGPTGSHTFENRTEVNGRKLFVTMVIKRIEKSDSGQYRCMLLNATTSYGFGITYIAMSDLPDINVSRNTTIELGESVNLVCNITRTGNMFKVKLVAIAWLKDSERIAEVPPSEGRLKDLKLTINDPQDAGHYKCELTSLLHSQRTYNITQTIFVQVRPKFGAVDLRRNEIIRIKGEPAVFHCNASGNPIKIVWKRKPRNKNKIILFNETNYSNESIHETRYKFSRENKYQGYKLEIPKTDYEDRGDYYCCIKSSSNASDQCQRFTLRVKDPLRHLWPLLGIFTEAVLLYAIIVLSEKAKKPNQQLLSRSDDIEDLSHTSTATEGKQENIRLRRTGTTTLDP